MIVSKCLQLAHHDCYAYGLFNLIQFYFVFFHHASRYYVFFSLQGIFFPKYLFILWSKINKNGECC
jgi:hypothetical protein